MIYIRQMLTSTLEAGVIAGVVALLQTGYPLSTSVSDPGL